MRTIVKGMVVLAAGWATLAAASSKTNYRVGTDVFAYGSRDIETKPNSGAAVTNKETEIRTFSSSWEFYANTGNFHLYIFPGQKGTAFAGGYSVLKALEVGATVSLASTTREKAEATKNKESINDNAYGVYATYNLELGKSAGIELGLNLDFSGKNGSHTDAAGAKTKHNTSGSGQKLSVIFDHGCFDDVHVYAALAYVRKSVEDKEAKTTTTTSGFDIVPLGLRYNWN